MYVIHQKCCYKYNSHVEYAMIAEKLSKKIVIFVKKIFLKMFFNLNFINVKCTSCDIVLIIQWVNYHHTIKEDHSTFHHWINLQIIL